MTIIGPWTFFACYSLTNVTIPNSVTIIGNGAFAACTSLANVTIPQNVTTIGYRTFWACYSLTNVTIPGSVTTIGVEAFVGCYSLTSLMIPNSVTTIANGAFAACTNLTNFTFSGNAPLLLGDLVFYNVGASATVYYYYGTTGWGSSYGGLPTVMLGAPASRVSTGTAGVKQGGFGFTVAGVVNQTIVVEGSTNLVTWQPVWTNTLSAASTNFVDPRWLNHPRRFYRMRSN